MLILWRGYFLLCSIPPPVIIIWSHIMFDPHKMQNRNRCFAWLCGLDVYSASLFYHLIWMPSCTYRTLSALRHRLLFHCVHFTQRLHDEFTKLHFHRHFHGYLNFTITAFSNFPNYGIWWDDAIAHAHRNLFGINYYQVLSFYILQVFVGGLQQSGSTQCRPLITCTTTAWVKQQVWVTPTTADNIHRAALCQRAESLAIFAVSDEPL